MEIKDSTLVAWASIEDPDVRGGSILTLGEGSLFDGLIFAERLPGKWTAGSEFWHRSPTPAQLDGEGEATPNETMQVALVHQGTQASLYYDGKQVASWTMGNEQPLYGNKSYALFGLRHRDAEDKASFFKGTVADARVYNQALSADQIAALKPHEKGDVEPVAWWDFTQSAKDKMGLFPDFTLGGNASLGKEGLHLHGAGDSLTCFDESPAINRVQFRPHVGNFADPIPIFWKGQYHVFYLQGGIGRVPWQHLVSTDLVHWKQTKTALRSDGAPDSWDGGNMFTGTVIEHAGKFYCYYTGDNGANKAGNEGVRMATSHDLITWHKQPDFLVVPDGKIYATKRDPNETKMIRDFRDPFPYKIPGKDEWWMILCANDSTNAPGVYTSDDLLKWKAAPPLDAAMQECPDLFKIGETYYLIGADHYSTSTDLRGKFVRPTASEGFIDRPGIYAGKRMFDGKRQIFVGWIADTQDFHDDAKLSWGGTMCSPRELVPGPNGVLYVKPAQEVIDAFSKPVLDLSADAAGFPSDGWSSDGGQFTSKAAPAKAALDLPDEGMLEMSLKLSPDAVVTVAFHSDDSKGQEGYAYTFGPASDKVQTHGQNLKLERKGCTLDASQPITVRAILIGDSIEFFLNDQYAFTRRAYDLRGGKLGLQVTQGTMTVQSMKFSQLPDVAP